MEKFSNNAANITKLFSEYRENITKEQYELISYLWGFRNKNTFRTKRINNKDK